MEWELRQKRFVTLQAKRENGQEDLQVIRSNRSAFRSMHSPARIHADHTPHSPAPAPQWRKSPSWTASCAPPGYLNHWHRHACHQCIHHMAMPENVGRDLPSGELLPARDLLNPGLFCQAVYGPEHNLGTQVARAPAREEPLLAQAGCSP